MQRIHDVTAAASLPSPPTLAGTVGYWTEGVPGVTAATLERGWWFNMVQEELLAVLTAAGVTPDTTAASFGQVLASLNLLYAPGRLINVKTWLSHSGSPFTYTPTAGTNSTVWEVRGAGGSGGGAGATTTAQIAAGGGGGSGAFVRHRALSGFAGATVVVGTGGAAPTAGANNGNAGTTSSVTALASAFTLTAPGGSGGGGVASSSISFITGEGFPGTTGSGGNLATGPGDQGGNAFGIIATTNCLISGDGGSVSTGGGAPSVGSTNTGLNGSSPGAGGGGGASGGGGSGGVATAGGAGSDGGVWVWEFS